MAYCQSIKTAHSEYTYYTSLNSNIEEAKNIALHRAKIKALEKEFGSNISQSNTTIINNKEGQTTTSLLSFGGSDVKGEWVETIKEPIYEISINQDFLVIKVKVDGKIRPIAAIKPELSIHILRNGTEEKYEDENFRNGDDIFLSFCSPINGYLAVYLYDNREVYRLLPYKSQETGSTKIKENVHYIFFSSNLATKEDTPFVNEYTLTCNNEQEWNNIYILFSPNVLTKLTDKNNDRNLPMQLTFEKFKEWLTTRMRKDKDFQCIERGITIRK